MTEKDSNSMRLNKYISESGFCSRREADKYVEAKNVFINGKIAQLGDRVGPKDVVRVNGIEIEPRPKDEAIYILFNKPTGVTSTTDSSDKDNIIDYIRYGERIFPVGRLDKDSQGLIILTSNGDIVNKILRAGNQHEKEYVVTVDKPVTPQFVEAMSSGVPILGVNTRKCKIHAESKFIFRITLTQGMNRQIRRMCEHFGYTVVKLERVRIMNLSVKGIALGDYREMKPKELAELHELIKDSEMSTDPILRVHSIENLVQADLEVLKDLVQEASLAADLVADQATDLVAADLIAILRVIQIAELIADQAQDLIADQVLEQKEDQVLEQKADQVLEQKAGQVLEQKAGQVVDQKEDQVVDLKADQVVDLIADPVVDQIVDRAADQVAGRVVANQGVDQDLNPEAEVVQHPDREEDLLVRSVSYL